MKTEIIEVKSLLPTAYADREKFFLNENNEVQPLIEAVKSHYSSIAFDGMDGSTEEGRKALKKLAAELNNKIKEIDSFGKEITDLLRAKPAKIDAGRRAIKEALGELYEEIRKPALEYEAEQARIKAEELAKIDAQRKSEQEELERLRADKARAEREALLVEEAAHKARLESENKAREAELALQREREAYERKERERLAEEKRKSDETIARQLNDEHRRNVKNTAYNDLCNFGIDKETAKNIIILIDEGKIQNLSINY